MYLCMYNNTRTHTHIHTQNATTIVVQTTTPSMMIIDTIRLDVDADSIYLTQNMTNLLKENATLCVTPFACPAPHPPPAPPPPTAGLSTPPRDVFFLCAWGPFFFFFFFFTLRKSTCVTSVLSTCAGPVADANDLLPRRVDQVTKETVQKLPLLSVQLKAS